MAYERTGYKRSLKVSVTKTIDGATASGYPKQYPTATDVTNGYFRTGGINYNIPTSEELGMMSLSQYNALLLKFKQYVLSNEPELSFASDFVNSSVIYDEATCPPGEVI